MEGAGALCAEGGSIYALVAWSAGSLDIAEQRLFVITRAMGELRVHFGWTLCDAGDQNRLCSTVATAVLGSQAAGVVWELCAAQEIGSAGAAATVIQGCVEMAKVPSA